MIVYVIGIKPKSVTKYLFKTIIQAHTEVRGDIPAVPEEAENGGRRWCGSSLFKSIDFMNREGQTVFGCRFRERLAHVILTEWTAVAVVDR